MPGPTLLLPEREEISRALTLDPTVSWARLAARVDRHRTTIAREVERNGGRDHYRSALADQRAARCARRRRPRLLEAPGELRDRVTHELAAGRSPYATQPTSLPTTSRVDPASRRSTRPCTPACSTSTPPIACG